MLKAIVLIACALALAPSRALAAIACPVGGRLVGAPPPNGNEAWCELLDKSGRWTKSGPWIAWYKSGQLRAEGEYVDGRRDGRWTIWNPRGETIAELIYDHGWLKQRAMEGKAEKKEKPNVDLVDATETATKADAIEALLTPKPDKMRTPLAPAEPEIDPLPPTSKPDITGESEEDEDDDEDESDSSTSMPGDKPKANHDDDDDDDEEEVAPPKPVPPKPRNPTPVRAVLRPKPQTFVEQLWSSVTVDSDTCEYELGIPFMGWVPLPYGAKRIAPHWWVGGSTELAYGQLVSAAPSNNMSFFGGAGFIRGVFTTAGGLIGVMVYAKGGVGIMGFGGSSGSFNGGTGVLALLELDVTVLNEHIVLAGGALGVGFSLDKGDAVLAYAFRTLGVRFTF